MNIVRLGHFNDPLSGEGIEASRCLTALVCRVIEADPDTQSRERVVVAVWDDEGNSWPPEMVEVDQPTTHHPTFHLSADCPWHR